MANEIEIVVSTSYRPGELQAAAQRIRSDAQDLARDLDRIFDRAADRMGQSFSDVGSKVNRELSQIRDEDVEVKVQVDTSEVRRAEGDIRDLDSIPPPTIEVQADASSAVADVEQQFGNLDFGNVGQSLTSSISSVVAPGGVLGAVALGVGAMFEESISTGIERGFRGGATTLSTQIQTGFGPEKARLIGDQAGAAYSGGFADTAAQALDAAIVLERKLGEVDPSFNLEEATKWASVLSNQLGVEVTSSAELAGRMIQQGLARNTEDAYDIMIDAAQRYGHQTEDVLDAVREFGSVFQKLGIEGPAAVRLVGDSYEQGLTSQVERAAEAMEELNTRITDGDSREAIEGLGLSFNQVQQAIAEGGPTAARAIEQITTALINETDAADQAAAANAIFGTSFETAADVEAFARIIRDATDANYDYAGSADEVTDQVAAMQTEWDKAQRRVEDFAKFLGTQFAREQNNAAEAGNKLLDVGRDMVGWLGDLGGAADDTTARTRVLDGAFDGFVDTFDQVPSVLAEGTRATGDVADAADDATRAWDAMARASANALAEVNRWADNSGTDAVIGLFDATTRLEQQFAETNAGAFDLARGFDLTTEAGVRGQAMVNGYEQDLHGLISAYADGDITARQLSDSLATNEARFRAAADAAGFEKAQVDALTDSLFGAAREWVAEINAEGNVWAQVDAASLALSGINGRRATVYVNVVETVTRYINNIARWFGNASGSQGTSSAAPAAFYAQGSQGIAAAQTGAAGVPTLVNEAGQEAVRLPQGDVVDLPVGSSVMTAPDRESFVNAGGRRGGGPLLEVNVTVMGTVVSGRDLTEAIRDEIYRGGFDGAGGVL